MERLAEARGATFDRLFLELMIQHHQGAIEMVDAVVREGADLQVNELATGIAADQTAEVDRMRQLLDIDADDVGYVCMPLFHSNALMVGWAPALVSGASVGLARRFSASGWLPDVRRYGATWFNYTGKPLSYLVATPEQPDDADNTLRIAYGNEGSPEVVAAFSRRFRADPVAICIPTPMRLVASGCRLQPHLRQRLRLRRRTELQRRAPDASSGAPRVANRVSCSARAGQTASLVAHMPLQSETHGWPFALREALGNDADPDDRDLVLPHRVPARAGAIVIHPGAAFASRCWPAGRWARVARTRSNGRFACGKGSPRSSVMRQPGSS